MNIARAFACSRSLRRNVVYRLTDPIFTHDKSAHYRQTLRHDQGDDKSGLSQRVSRDAAFGRHQFIINGKSFAASGCFVTVVGDGTEISYIPRLLL